MEYSYKFRAYPTAEQMKQIQRTFGCCRFVYNYYLAKRIDAYKTDKTTLGYKACSADMTALKKQLPWLGEVDSTALQSSLRDFSPPARLVAAADTVIKMSKTLASGFGLVRSAAHSMTATSMRHRISLQKGFASGYLLPDNTFMVGRDTPEPIRLGRPCKTSLVQAAVIEPRIPRL